MKGLIVIGYPGVGKSSCAGRNGCIDLESSTFYVGEKRREDWYIPYCQIAMSIANQGYTVFVSSHKVVCKHLAGVPLPENVGKVVLFCPMTIQKNAWIERLQERYDKTKLVKDHRAWRKAKYRFVDDICDMIRSGLPVYQPMAMDYDLMDYVNKMRNDWCH